MTTYKWKRTDIDTVRIYLRKENGDITNVTNKLLDLIPHLQINDIQKAITIAKAHITYEKGQITLTELLQLEHETKLYDLPYQFKKILNKNTNY